MATDYVNKFRGDHFYTPDRVQVKNEPMTPSEEAFDYCDRLDYSFEDEGPGMKKSLSMNDIAALRQDLLSLDVQNDKEEVYHRYRKVTGGTNELLKTKFVSMAEAIYHFQRDTPGRFHSTRPSSYRPQNNGPTGLTRPQSPILRCKARSRPLHIMTQQEREEMELEEIRKFKIKAHPVPKSVLEGSKNLPEVSKKPTTVPEPFKLTQMHKKSVVLSEDHYRFKARPAPKHILERPQVPIKPPVQVTKPVSPKLQTKFYGKRATSVDKLKIDRPKTADQKKVHKVERHGPVRPEPFSFEKRDEELKRQREIRIKQQIEEERKMASQFKAQPLPGVVRKRMVSLATKGCSSSTSSENKENLFKFEARPPTVLYKEPFKPVLNQISPVKTEPFKLTTEKRAAERERFDKFLKDKEDEQERIRLQREKEQQEQEERIKVELRAKMVHHAKPIPVALENPFIPEKVGIALTVPETPKFVRRMKQH